MGAWLLLLEAKSLWCRFALSNLSNVSPAIPRCCPALALTESSLLPARVLQVTSFLNYPQAAGSHVWSQQLCFSRSSSKSQWTHSVTNHGEGVKEHNPNSNRSYKVRKTHWNLKKKMFSPRLLPSNFAVIVWTRVDLCFESRYQITIKPKTRLLGSHGARKPCLLRRGTAGSPASCWPRPSPCSLRGI